MPKHCLQSTKVTRHTFVYSCYDNTLSLSSTELVQVYFVLCKQCLHTCILEFDTLFSTLVITDTIRIKRRLGSGQFGFVEQGVWRNGTRDIPIALKRLKEGATETDKVKFLQEAAIMAQFTHPNVVSLYGVVSKTESVR